MDDIKIIGLLCGWACEWYIELAVIQALKLCDEVHVCIAPHTEAMKKYEDKTARVIDRYKKSVKILDWDSTSYHAETKADILNTMLYMSEIYEVGNWIWILDTDEFYSDGFGATLRNFINTDGARLGINNIVMDEYYFFINMQHYLEGHHGRLFKIKEENMDKDRRFRPTQNWYNPLNIQAWSPREMYHYGMLFTSIKMKKDFWATEYQHEQNYKIRWLESIYRNYDLDNEDYWINQNKSMFGLKSPWYEDSFQPDENGRLFRYIDKHPSLIENAGFPKIKDFRD